MQTRDQEEHPVLKSDHLVHNFGLFKQVRKWSHFSRREIMFSSKYTKVFLVSFFCEEESIFFFFQCLIAPLRTVLVCRYLSLCSPTRSLIVVGDWQVLGSAHMLATGASHSTLVHISSC